MSSQEQMEKTMHHNPHSAFMGAAAAFAFGVQRNRARRAAYVEAVIAGREEDARRRQMAAMAKALNAATRRADAAAAKAVADRIVAGLRHR